MRPWKEVLWIVNMVAPLSSSPLRIVFLSIPPLFCVSQLKVLIDKLGYRHQRSQAQNGSNDCRVICRDALGQKAS